MPKITLIGAGSVIFTKNLLGDFLSFPELEDCTISLYDIDPLRLETAEAMAQSTARSLQAHPIIEAHLDRKRALEGADYVINMVQVGGHTATLIDFDIPRKYGLRQTIGDSHGIGGIFRGLRTIPVLLDIAADMQRVCPDALLINYSNPMSMLTRAVFEATNIKIVGLCHSVQFTTRQISKYARLPYEEVSYLGAGINHMSWILRFEHNGQDAYPLLRQALADGRIPRTDLVRAELFRRFGYYITESSEHLAEYIPYFIPHIGQVEKFNIPIDEYVRRSEANLRDFETIRARLLRGETFPVHRSAEYASLIIHAMETDEPLGIYGNVCNDHLITNLPEGCCVEVPCTVSASGIQPAQIGKLPPQLAGLILPHVTVQELTVRAALHGQREYVYQAAMLDPLTSATLTLDKIWDMVDEMIAAHGQAMPEGIRPPEPAISTTTEPLASQQHVMGNSSSLSIPSL